MTDAHDRDPTGSDPEPPGKEGPDTGDDVLWARWEEVDALLDAVLDLGPSAREEFLRARHPDDPALVARVLELATDEVHAEEAPLHPGSDLLRAALDGEERRGGEDPMELLGSMVGVYRLVRVLGAGGMGAVYEAERADETFERTVAVKILKGALASREVVRRFELERQILASLNHPSIAQLIDGGLTDDGRPYLAMELVDGVRIDEWADRERLGVADRVRLVVQVMSAVEHAHRHLVIHRDLKPSNILVRDDGSVKLLDFGVARLLDEPAGQASATRTGARFLTPEYAAPEQLLGEAASTQTDVYSTGILLYELLTGTRPYQASGGKTILEQVVQGGVPTAPSSALPPVETSEVPVGSRGVGPDSVYTARSASPELLRKQLRGDLDAILIRALRARPSERYSTVSAFREDLERHLDGRPVRARGDARGYRMRRFVARHRWAVSSAAATFLFVTGSAIGLAMQRGRLIEQTDRAEAATAQASREAETSQAVTNFLTELFESSDPTLRLGDTLTARALVQRGVERIDGELQTEPAVRAELLAALGDVHVSLGLRDEGVELHQRAVALLRDSISASTGLGSALFKLGEAQRFTRRLDDAEAAYREAIPLLLGDGDSVPAAWAQVGLGQVLSHMNRPDEAEPVLRAGLAVLAPADEATPEGWAGRQILAGIVRRQGDLEGARDLLAAVAEERRRARDTPMGLARTLNDLGVVEGRLSRPAAARLLFEEAIDTAEAVLGMAHPETLTLRQNYATTLRSAGSYDEAAELMRASLRATEEEWPDGHWQVANHNMLLGATLMEAGRAEEAIPYLSASVDLGIAHIGRYHSWTAVYRGWVGAAAAATGREEAAAQFFGWSLEGLQSYEQLRSDRNVSAMVQGLVDTMRRQGLEEEAEPFAALLGTTP